MEPFTDYGRLAYDHQQVTAALHRYTSGLDNGNGELLASSLTEQAVFDLTPAARKLGIPFPALKGRQIIVETLMRLVGPLDTSHATSNIQVTLEDGTAALTAYVMAQHYLPDRGPDPADTRHSLFMNRYDTALVQDGDQWRFTHVAIDNLWFDGDLDVALHGATV